MASVEANGITIEYDVQGAGDPLLLVMGLGGQLTDWPQPVVDMFVARGFRVIRFDNRDIGLSTEFDWEPPSMARNVLAMAARRPVQAGYTILDMAADAAGVLAALSIEAAHVVGMSMGGMIAQQLAISHPSTVRSLTSIMSNTGDRKRGGISKRLLPKLARRPEPTRENAVDESVRLFRMISGPAFDAVEHRRLATLNLHRSFRPQGTARQAAAIAASPDRTAGLRGVAAPTLVVHGLRDPLVLPSGGAATATAVPGSRLVMYPDMGHDLPRTRLDEIVDAVRRNADRAG
jgi:pimeloyl-ACP methyl ester carboxylesterase